MALPTPPPEMSRDDETGAIAAVTYFMTDLYTYTVVSQDTAPWGQMSHSLCNYCSGITTAVEAQRDAQVTTQPGQIVVTGVTSDSLSPLSYSVKLNLSLGRDLELSRTGAVLDDRPPKTVTMGTVAVWQVDRWLIRGVDVLVDNGTPQ